MTKSWWFLATLAGIAVLGLMIPLGGQTHVGGPVNGADTAWMLTATALVLLMTPGLSFFYGGMVRAKNVVSTLMQSFMAMAVISLLWVVVGFSLSFGESVHGLIGDPRTFFMFRGVGGETHAELAPTIPLIVFALFQLKFAIITPALITGAFAERVSKFSRHGRLSSPCWSVCLVYSPHGAYGLGHPGGMLNASLGGRFPTLDFAGGTVVHITCRASPPWSARNGTWARRKVGYPREKAPWRPPTSRSCCSLVGACFLWVGWFGFNAGSALTASPLAALAFATTNTASAAAMLGWLAFDFVRGRKPSAMGACVGAVVGLVAVTPAAGYITVGQSIAVGLIASVVSNLAAHFKSRTALDDTLDVFPCHGLGGVVGMILTGVLAKDVGLVAGHWETFAFHLLALVIVSVFSFGGSWVLYKLVDKIVPLRVTKEQEEEGLDLSQHGESLNDSMPSVSAPVESSVGSALAAV